jgi:L-malate glycosyltransferase
VILTFLTPSTPFPAGGAAACLEFANTMARRGHETHVVHLDIAGTRARDLADLDWIELEGRLLHDFSGSIDDTRAPESDFVFCFDDRIPAGRGQTLMWVHGYRTLDAEIERKIFFAPCPKLCIGKWLTELLADLGVPETQLIHVPYGLKHEKYRVVTPLDSRPPRVAMLYSVHPIKRARDGITALELAREEHPEMEATLFGTSEPARRLPSWMDFVHGPSQVDLVERIYNGSRMFLQPSRFEGFGLAAVEAMACGCALVTTDNGGSRDYAVDGETALVSAPGDCEAMASNIVALLSDDAHRQRIAERGRDYVQRFDWDRAAEILESRLVSLAA